MSIIYKRLFNLRIGHDYYKKGLAKGMTITPSPATEVLLRNGKMLFKTITAGAVILYRAWDDEVTPMVDLGKDVKLTFCLTIDNAYEFFNVTELDVSTQSFQSSNILYFRNDPANASDDPANPELITHQILDRLSDPLFDYEFKITASPVNVLLRVADENGTLVSIGRAGDGTPLPDTLTVAKGPDDIYRQQIDLRNYTPGRYTVTVRNAADTLTLKEEVIYADRELASRPILGIVDIVYETGTDHIYDDIEEYRLAFTRKETFWKYFIVDKNKKVDLVTYDLSITDTGSGGGDPYDVYNFTREGAEPHANIRVNDADTVVFVSNVPIPFYEEPKLNLELRKNPSDQQVIVNLPNPSHSGVIKDDGGNPSSEIYVFI